MNMTESSPSENLRIYRWYKPPVLLLQQWIGLQQWWPRSNGLVAKINAFGCNTSTTISKLVKLEGHIFMVQALE